MWNAMEIVTTGDVTAIPARFGIAKGNEHERHAHPQRGQMVRLAIADEAAILEGLTTQTEREMKKIGRRLRRNAWPATYDRAEKIIKIEFAQNLFAKILRLIR